SWGEVSEGGEAPLRGLAARGVAEGDDDERAVGVGGAYTAAVGGDRLAEPAHTRNARVHLVLDRRPLVARGGAEGPMARVRLDDEDEPRGVTLEALDRRARGLHRPLDQRRAVGHRTCLEAIGVAEPRRVWRL